MIHRLAGKLRRLRQFRTHWRAQPDPAAPSPTRVGRLQQLIGEMNVHELAAARLHLRNQELSADNHYFNPERPWSHLRRYQDSAPGIINHEFLRGRTLLEFGSGTKNALSVGTLLLLNGAEHVVAYEPFPVKLAQSTLARDELLLAAVRDPQRFALDGTPAEVVRQRAVDLLSSTGPELCTTREDLASKTAAFDVVISNHVLEHVGDLDHELAFIAELITPSAVQVHRVDFRDHRLFSQPASKPSKVEFYRDGELTTCNGLRASDVNRSFRARGWSTDVVNEQRIDESELPTEICDRFRGYKTDDLVTITADWIVHEPG